MSQKNTLEESQKDLSDKEIDEQWITFTNL